MTPKRSIFEEVGDKSPAARATRTAKDPQGGLIDGGARGARGAIRIWLFVLFALVVAMIGVGGATRLTDSGLSITEWKPVTGALPPMNAQAWDAEFALYRATPQFSLMNPDMTLSEFKGIYWWEWAHRQLGRLMGLVWGLGFLGFLVTRKIPPGWTGRLLGIGLLGGLQGAIGWWMVSSGLINDMTSVASYRLAVHLGLAFLILGLIAWYAMSLGRGSADLLQARRAGDRKLFGIGTGLLHLTFVQVLLGALVAGIDAGRGFTDWPLMGGQILPPDPFQITPMWRNFFEDSGLVQFNHRIVGYLVLVLAVVAVLLARRSPHASVRIGFAWAATGIFLQLGLGIVTLVHGAPLPLGLAHQLGAVLAFTLILRARFLARYPVVQSIRGSK